MRAPEYHWIAVDIETCPREEAKRWLKLVKADGRLTDAGKIAADLAKKQTEQVEKMALDWNASRIEVLGYQTESMDEPSVNVCGGLEAGTLEHVWELVRGRDITRTILSFNGIKFDVPTMVQRSRYLGVSVPHLSFRKWDNPHIRDLFMELTFDDLAREDKVVSCTLDMFCEQFGIDIKDDVKGEDVPKLIAAGEIERVVEHCRKDVLKTVALARAIGAIYVPSAEPQEVI
jgi:uncharacterized protein YprB with RNaseH-like and TPR domain